MKMHAINNQNGSSCVLSKNASFAARRIDAQFYYYYRYYYIHPKSV